MNLVDHNVMAVTKRRFSLVKCATKASIRSTGSVPRKVRSWHFRGIGRSRMEFRFSNRPFGVKHFQTIHDCSVDVTRGLVLLFGIGTKALP